jgi:regulatory protein
MQMRRHGSSRRPLDSRMLDDLALRYVGRYATTQAKLRHYLRRKVAERGWSGQDEPDFEVIVARLNALGYVDDRAFALAKADHHTARGLGRHRLTQSLRAAGIGDSDQSEALDRSSAGALESALRFARRRRLGPFAAKPADSPADREKAIAAFIRAGHGVDLARRIVSLAPKPHADIENLRRILQHTLE